MWLYLKNKTTLFSHLCLSGPALGQYWEQSLAIVPDFLSELLPTGAFHPRAVLLIPGISLHPLRHAYTTSHYFISPQPFKMSLTVSHPLIALLGFEGIMNINGSCNKKSS